MSRTTRRTGWTYWESNKRYAVENNPLFGNKGWIMKSDVVNEAYRSWMAGEPVSIWDDVSAFIHRDLKKGWRYEAHRGYLEYNKFAIRAKQRAALHKVMLGDDYLLDERSVIKRDRGISEWFE